MMSHAPLRSMRLLLLASLLCELPLALPASPVGATGNTWTVNDLGTAARRRADRPDSPANCGTP